MSFRTLMTHRAELKRLSESDVDGAPSYQWHVVKKNIRCYLDLTYLRAGKDPVWTPEAGRATDRTGVFFCLPDAGIVPGDRVVVFFKNTVLGTFQIDGAFDTVIGTRGRPHHLEAGVKEVAAPLGRA